MDGMDQPQIGPMIVVCPEHAVLGPEDRVIYQAMAIANWQRSVFVLGGADWPDHLAPYQDDYVNSLEALIEEGNSLRLQCGSTVSEVETGMRMLMRNKAFQAACSGRDRVISVCGGFTEAHVRRVVNLLNQSGYQAVVSMISIAYADVNPELVQNILSAQR